MRFKRTLFNRAAVIIAASLVITSPLYITGCQNTSKDTKTITADKKDSVRRQTALADDVIGKNDLGFYSVYAKSGSDFIKTAELYMKVVEDADGKTGELIKVTDTDGRTKYFTADPGEESIQQLGLSDETFYIRPNFKGEEGFPWELIVKAGSKEAAEMVEVTQTVTD